MDITTFDLNNRITEDEAIEQAYDIFLELASDNLDPADVILFNLQFEQRGAAESHDPLEDWLDYVDIELDPEFFTEVVIGLTNDDDIVDDIFARILICLEKDNKFCHIIWKN